MKTDYQHILDCLPVSSLNHQEWVEAGMALKLEGCPFEMWDAWSATDTRPDYYRGTEYNLRKWDSFDEFNTASPVTGATLTEMARMKGTDPFPSLSGPLNWNDYITQDDVEISSVVSKPNQKLKSRQRPIFQIIDYLEAIFKPEDYVNVITTSFLDEVDHKYKPAKMGLFQETVGEYIESLRNKADKTDKDAFDETFGSYNPEAGVWIRVNPVTNKIPAGQKGIKDENIVRFENCLVECDEGGIEDQIEKIKALKLPYKALVYSGGKSVHAIVRVDGKNLPDWKNRVNWLFDYCQSHGMPIDPQVKNPSRLTRLPGVTRKDQQQFLIQTNQPMSFDEWKRCATAEIEADQLEIESFQSVCKDLPPMSPEIIHGILRRGHKMLISGPSKAGKSFALIALAAAIVEGRDWMGYECQQGKVLYLNLEIDRPSFLNRVDKVYEAKGWEKKNPENLQFLHLRGCAEPLDILTPKLEVIVSRTPYTMVIVDPIYKVITGDENSASDMGQFCNLFDRIAKAGHCAVAYCHHHSKGSQAQKTAMDRASGSGVFARDPDAIIDMTELDFTQQDKEELAARMTEVACDNVLKNSEFWTDLKKTNPEQAQDRVYKQEMVEELTHEDPALKAAYDADLKYWQEVAACKAFRLSMTLREFASPDDVNVFFKYPVHVKDPTGFLTDMYLVGDNSVETMVKKKKEKAANRGDKRLNWVKSQRQDGKPVTAKDIMERFNVSKNTVIRWADSQEGVYRKTFKNKSYILFDYEDLDNDGNIIQKESESDK